MQTFALLKCNNSYGKSYITCRQDLLFLIEV